MSNVITGKVNLEWSGSIAAHLVIVPSFAVSVNPALHGCLDLKVGAVYLRATSAGVPSCPTIKSNFFPPG